MGISSASFSWYGMSCLLSRAMAVEFERYRLASYRVLTGVLQIAASAGLLIGLLVGFPARSLVLASAGGLATMMFLAVIVRVRIRDPLYAAIPALVFFCLNAFIVVSVASYP